ncbi:PKD domain-containing protein, partial [Candidatus Bipolaricaulota bacterium]|nr:PKD domain-containing protein [Candidatus Bipolaricaulota bacterium]
HFIDRSCDPSPTGAIIHVAWDFGDGTSCPGLPGCCGDGDIHSPTHIYDVPGLYTVTLIVIDEEGALSNISRTLRVKE